MSNSSVEEMNMIKLGSVAWKDSVQAIIQWCVGCVLTFSIAWSASPTAIASPPSPFLASTPDAIKDLANEVEDSVDELSGARAGEREGIGTVERHVDVKRQIETGKQIEGRAKRELERSQRAADIKTEIQNAADDLSDRVQGAIGQ
jgi:hypothetical protein